MLTEKKSEQKKYEMVMIEELVEENHLLRAIDIYVNFSFIYDKVRDLYSPNNGRPSIDPVVLFKMLLVGYLYGIKSERQLEIEIRHNVAYRWFLGYTLTEKTPDHSTISQNRRRRFKETTIFEEIFTEIVMQAMNLGFVEGTTMYSDSTHIKANANKKKFTKEQLPKKPDEYIDELEQAINEERAKHSEKPLRKNKKNDDDAPPPTKTTKISTTDKDSGYMVQDDKPKGFFYKDHRTVDSKYNIVVDTQVTAGNVHDSKVIGTVLDNINKRFDKYPEYIGLDAGYYNNKVCYELDKREIQGVIGYRSEPHEKGKYLKWRFEYDYEHEAYICPNQKLLTYQKTTSMGYSQYQANPCDCANCTKKEKCVPSNHDFKKLNRHVWEGFKDQIRKFTRTEKGKELYEKRKETIERSFADSKQNHGHRYARMKGLPNVQEQCFLVATAQNIKKIAIIATRLFPRLRTI